MIISGTGIPASPLTKVKDALFLAVYFMQCCPCMPSYSFYQASWLSYFADFGS